MKPITPDLFAMVRQVCEALISHDPSDADRQLVYELLDEVDLVTAPDYAVRYGSVTCQTFDNLDKAVDEVRWWTQTMLESNTPDKAADFRIVAVCFDGERDLTPEEEARVLDIHDRLSGVVKLEKAE